MARKKKSHTSGISSIIKHPVFWSSMTSILTGVVIVFVIQLRSEKFDVYLAEQEQALEKYYKTASLVYRRCGINLGLSKSPNYGAYCLSIINVGESPARNANIVLSNFSGIFLIRPVTISPPYDEISPRTSPNESFIVYEVSSIPENSFIQIWFEFSPNTRDYTELTTQDFEEFWGSNDDDLSWEVIVTATCDNCIGDGMGDLLWPPEGVILPPPVQPIGPPKQDK